MQLFSYSQVAKGKAKHYGPTYFALIEITYGPTYFVLIEGKAKHMDPHYL